MAKEEIRVKCSLKCIPVENAKASIENDMTVNDPSKEIVDEIINNACEVNLDNSIRTDA